MRFVDAIFLSRKNLFIYITALLTAMPVILWGQNKYGLEFASKDIDLDARTGVNMFPDKPFYAEEAFSLAFDISFIPNAGSYFGYVFRFSDEQQQHIDLVYNVRSASFDLIAGNHYTGISLKQPATTFISNWHNIRLNVDNLRRSFTLLLDGQTVGKADIHFKPGRRWKLYFGANRYERSKTFDLAPMRIKDIQLYQERHIAHHWPMHQYSGNTDTDIIGGQVAMIDNPIWLAHTYRNWQASADFTTMGNASVAFDQEKGTVYIGGRDTLYHFDCNKNVLRVDKLEHAHQLPAGNQSVFGGNKLYNFLTDIKKVSVYNKDAHSWDETADDDSVTRYWHANRFYSSADSAIYIIGGYGNYRFTNQVQRYSLADHHWETLPNAGSPYTPRYLAALGTTAGGDSAYIIGGYGSANGDQLLNPHNLYDLQLFDVKSGTFKKIYQLPEPEQPFAFGNSMVIDTKTQSYYALTFANDKMQSSIQLIHGSLQKPVYTKLANTIPFRYHDIRTRVELFYYPKGEKLIAVVLNTPENHVTRACVYTIVFPPAALEVTVPEPRSQSVLFWLLAAAGIITAGLLIYRMRYIFVSTPAAIDDETPVIVATPLPAPALVTITRTAVEEEEEERSPAIPPRPAIMLFGQFTVLDLEGNNISRLFSPLLKELFLLLLLHSLPGRKGISSDKINETLWPGRSGKDAKNNRSVNIVKLKNILDKLGSYTLEKDTDKWLLQFDSEKVDIDLVSYYRLSTEKSAAAFTQLTRLTGRGGLLTEIEYSWLDNFKSELTTEVNTQFLQYLESNADNLQPGQIISIANSMLNFDPLCEEAVMFKCKALVATKQHASARAIYNSFTKEYEATYGETFEKEYQELLVN